MKELDMTATQFNIVLQIFFVPYILLEVPSNLLLRKIKPSTWLSALVFFWGTYLPMMVEEDALLI